MHVDKFDDFSYFGELSKIDEIQNNKKTKHCYLLYKFLDAFFISEQTLNALPLVLRFIKNPAKN